MCRIAKLRRQTIEDLDYVNLIAVAEREISQDRHLRPPIAALRNAIYEFGRTRAQRERAKVLYSQMTIMTIYFK
jgi:hypothetical protein